MTDQDPGQVMTIEAYKLALQRKPASECTQKRFDLNQAINIMMGASAERIKAQKEKK